MLNGHRFASAIKDADFQWFVADATRADGTVPFEVLPMDPMRQKVREGAFDEPLGVQQVQDALYRRFRARYVDRTDGKAEFEPAYLGVSDGRDLSDEQRALLVALRDGDVAAIRELMRIDWNFVYPPADHTEKGGPTNKAGERVEEGWCRSPLALLVRPDEGNFGRFLAGVSREDRLSHQLHRDGAREVLRMAFCRRRARVAATRRRHRRDDFLSVARRHSHVGEVAHC